MRSNKTSLTLSQVRKVKLGESEIKNQEEKNSNILTKKKFNIQVSEALNSNSRSSIPYNLINILTA